MAEDNRVSIELDLDEDLLFELMFEAHRRDITLNQFVELILREFIERHKQEQANGSN